VGSAGPLTKLGISGSRLTGTRLYWAPALASDLAGEDLHSVIVVLVPPPHHHNIISHVWLPFVPPLIHRI
jgi:hypothetical protein